MTRLIWLAVIHLMLYGKLISSEAHLFQNYLWMWCKACNAEIIFLFCQIRIHDFLISYIYETDWFYGQYHKRIMLGAFRLCSKTGCHKYTIFSLFFQSVPSLTASHPASLSFMHTSSMHTYKYIVFACVRSKKHGCKVSGLTSDL